MSDCQCNHDLYETTKMALCFVQVKMKRINEGWPIKGRLCF